MFKYSNNFWSKVDVRGPDECWPWLGSVDKDGYGLFHYGSRTLGDRKLVKAHRMACELSHGPPPSIAHQALHSRVCNNPACCNGAHLRWGTHQDNVDDKVALGRQAKGELTNNAKLNARKVALIRAMYKPPNVVQKDLAKLFGVTQTMIGFIVRNESWRE